MQDAQGSNIKKYFPAFDYFCQAGNNAEYYIDKVK